MMSVPKRSTLSLDLNLSRSLIIYEMLKLELGLSENYNNRVEGYLYGDLMHIGQIGDDETRTVALDYPDDSGTVEVVLGYSLAFDAIEVDPDSVGDTVMVSVEEFEKQMPELQVHSPLHSVSFEAGNYIGAAKLIYRWLFPDNHEVV